MGPDRRAGADPGFGRPRVLIRALAWRTRREGLRYLLAGFVPFLIVTAGLAGSLALAGQVNGAASFAGFAARYGARAGAVQAGEVMILEPGFVAICSAIAVGLVVRNLIGSEASRGAIEALLAGPYRPGSIGTALLGYAGGLAVLYWAVMTAAGALTLAIVTWTSGATLSLSAAYVLLVLILPLLAAWSATSLSLLVTLLYPRLAQPGGFGLAIGGGGLGTGTAVLPALGVLLVFTFGAPSLSAGAVLAIAGGATAVIAAGSTLVIATRFRPERVLQS